MKKLCLLLLGMVSMAGLASAATYDLNADMSFTGNPNGVWSYGFIENGGYNLYDSVNMNQGEPGLHCWCRDNNPDHHGNILKNTTGSDVIKTSWPNEMKWFAGKTHMMISDKGTNADLNTNVRFTTPSSGSYTVSVDFLKASISDGCAVTAVVTLNGSTTLMSQQLDVSDEDASYLGMALSLTAGDTIDITVVPTNYEGNIGSYVITQVDAVITEVPEPATMTLLAVGGLALIRRRCR